MDDLLHLFDASTKTYKKHDLNGVQVFQLRTAHNVTFYVNPYTIVAIVEGVKLLTDIIVNAKEILNKDQTQEKLDHISRQIEEVKGLMLQVLDVLSNLGNVIDERLKVNTEAFVRDRLLTQVGIIQDEMPEMLRSGSHARAVANGLLEVFREPAYQLMLYGATSFQAVILAMVHHRELLRFADKKRETVVNVFERYERYFREVVLGEENDGSLPALIQKSQASGDELKAQLDRVPRAFKYADDHSSDDFEICDYEVWLVFDGDIESSFKAHREHRNVRCRNRGRGGRGEMSVIVDPQNLFYSGDEGWEQRMKAEVNRLNSLRNAYLRSEANVQALTTLLSVAREAHAAAQQFLREAQG
ncbi:hypothetical protein [Azospirillum sp.]|uniref:hypothetical protein n=1 Tax=Azospirillum sp. TaxID=34012 RepID=UPI002D6E9873|nr:hypothetical protein [Azospirillum sp.]HYD69279.1 hypothetical protein [Azospirillum sp.]